MKDREKLYWTPDEVREQIFGNQVSKATLLNQIHEKKIPAIRVGSRWYIPAHWVDERIRFARNQGKEEAICR
jgi:excisionase family DNA binding protein